MSVTYKSSQHGMDKELPAEIIRQVHAHIQKTFPDGINDDTTYGEINDALLAFRKDDGKTLLINQLHPFFLRLCLDRTLGIGGAK